MKRTLLLLCIALCSFVSMYGGEPIVIDKHEFDVRVLLDECDANHGGRHGFTWNFSSQAGFFVSDCANKCRAEIVPAQSGNKGAVCSITWKKNSFFFKNKKVALSCIKICSQDSQKPVYYNGNAYAGVFYLVYCNNNGDSSAAPKIFLINSVDLEDYIFSVLRWESWPGWPLEVNKALAIVCRTYVIKRILDGRKSKNISRPGYYDIKATNAHQTYNGAHHFSDLARALQETNGLILSYDKQPILAMYDSCCGGVVPADIEGAVDFSKAPYLARDYPCTHCRSCKLYRWSISYPKHDFERLLSGSLEHPVLVSSVSVWQKDKAGLASVIHVVAPERSYEYTGKQFYSLFKDIKSFCYSIVQEHNTVYFKGRGYGHHIGLCQWGACNMVRQGWDYKSVLRFYYPGTSFMKLEVI